MARAKLSDEHWERIRPFVEKKRESGKAGRRPVDRRIVVDGILWMVRTGSPWRDLPEEFGAWQTVWRLFNAWTTDGTLDQILQELQAARYASGHMSDTLWCVDGTIVRASRCAGGGGKKGIEWSRTTTRSAIRAVD